MQWRPFSFIAIVIVCVDIRPVLNEHLCKGHLIISDRMMKQCLAMLSSSVDIGSFIKKQLYHCEMVSERVSKCRRKSIELSRELKRSHALVIGSVDVGAALEEQPRDRHVAVFTSEVQRGRAAIVGPADVIAGVEEPRDFFQTALFGRLMQSSLAEDVVEPIHLGRGGLNKRSLHNPEHQTQTIVIHVMYFSLAMNSLLRTQCVL
jgi:hypothetical protein